MFKHVNWKLIGILVAGTVVVGAVTVYWIANRAAPPRYVTMAVTQGDVVTTITASESVNPVVSRNVTAGQTVAASFQTPTLFLIAADLTKMQVDTNVSESDIAGAVEGAYANFTADAFPNRTFQGRVAQVRQAPRQCAECDYVRCRDHGRQSRSGTQTRDDGDRQDRHGPIAACA